MNRDDIIRMAREAGIVSPEETGEVWCAGEWQLHEFAALVAAAEREKVAQWMMQRGYATGHGDTIEDLLVELDWQIRESEREECAKVCEEWGAFNKIAAECAEAIRARGKE